MIEEITIQELAAMEPSACQIIDMRDSTAFALGHIDGAVLIPQKELEASHENLPKDKTLVIYCRSGILSADVAEQLREEGYAAVIWWAAMSSGFRRRSGGKPKMKRLPKWNRDCGKSFIG